MGFDGTFNNDYLSYTFITDIFYLLLRFPISLLLISLGNYYSFLPRTCYILALLLFIVCCF
jgi:hypothetical protein